MSVKLIQVLDFLHCIGLLSRNERQDERGLEIVTIG